MNCFYSVIKYRDCCSLCILCISLLWSWQLEFMTHLLKGRSLPSLLYLESVQGVPGWHVYQCRASLSCLTRFWCLLFVSLSFGSCRFSFFFSIHCLWLRGQLNHFMFFPVVWSYFGETVFLAKHVSFSFKWLQQNECDSGFPSWHENLSSYISFWKISIFSLPWSYTAFKAFYILL